MLKGIRDYTKPPEIIDTSQINTIVAKRTYTLVSGPLGAWHCDLDAGDIVELCGGYALFDRTPANLSLGQKETFIRK